MNEKKLLSCLTAGVLALCLGFGGVACMVTGLKLPVDWLPLGFGCVIGAVVAAGCCASRHGGRILVGIGAVFALLMALSDRFLGQLKAMLYSMFHYYHQGYGIAIPDWFNGASADTQVLPLLTAAGLVMAVTAWVVLRRKSVIPAAAAALLPLTSCLVVTDTVPASFAIFIFLFGLTMLIMTAAVRRWDEAQGNRLAAFLALPVAAALALLMMALPQDHFQGPPQGGSLDSLFNWFAAKLPAIDQTFEGELVISLGGTAKQTVNLGSIGHNYLSKMPVMEVTAPNGGRLYLRGRSYDTYDGKSWSASTGRTEDFVSPPPNCTKTFGDISVKMLSRRGQYYLPYYPADNQSLNDGMLVNPNYAMEYSFQCRELKENWKDFRTTRSELDLSAYLELPEETRLRAEEYLENALQHPFPIQMGNQNYMMFASLIESHVKASASYDLKTDRMPGSETDFAMWFLEQSDTGYCVHFATATAVLLRAAGIPARYVEGYTVTAEPDKASIVRENMAHAWVEYYVNGIGWVIMDTTPGADVTPETTQTSPSGTTAPSTDPTTRPTEDDPITEPATEDPSDPSVGDPSQTIPSGSHGTSPSGSGTATPSGSGSGEQQELPQWFGAMLLWFAGIAVTIAAVLGQRMLRRHRKLQNMHQGRPNTQALVRFREVRRMAKLQGIPIPDELQQLAEKARFSQHTLTKEELAKFDAFLRDGTQALNEHPWYRRFVYRFVYAIY